ncbi:hypothetical protein DXB52_12590 [Ruminococcus sp. OM04-4AA]|nr:hypothetical protein DXB52_12590 [Ruminococcus sp. OM04-4AA]
MMKKHHAVTMQMGTNTHIFDCGRGYGETKSPSSCKSEKIPQGFLSDIAKLALKMTASYISRFTEKMEIRSLYK